LEFPTPLPLRLPLPLLLQLLVLPLLAVYDAEGKLIGPAGKAKFVPKQMMGR
jgi:hypothetical protein